MALLSILIALLLVGCKKPAPLAILERASGSVQRDHQAQVGRFEPAEPGAEFYMGEAVRTGEAARAKLRLDDRSGLELEPKTLLRFMDHPPGSKSQHLALEMGEAVLQSADDPLSVQTEFGVAEIAAHGRVTLKKTESGGTRFEVAIGSARLLSGNERFEVTTGEAVEISKERGIVPLSKADAPVAPSAQPASNTAPKERSPGGVATEIRGTGARVRPPGEKDFVDLPAGSSEQKPGSTLRLSSSSSATLRRGSERAELSGGGEYLVGDAATPLATTTDGDVSFDSGDRSLTLNVPGGSIVIHERSRVRTQVSAKRGTEVVVNQGGATVTGSEGTKELATGERMTLAPGGDVEVVRGRGPGVVDLVTAARDSFVVHDPRPPTAIAFVTAGKCAQQSVLAFATGTRHERQTVGKERVSMELGEGSHRYAISCLDSQDQLAKVAEGTVTVLRDSGSRRLPRGSPRTNVEADGRRYTVLYQSVLPDITVTWPNAPAGSSKLTVVSNGATKTYTASGKSYAFRGGALGEGTHQLTFEGGGLRSRPTTVFIRFDNAAPAASLSSPSDGGFAMGQGVTVAGSALPGWTVSVGGQELAQDDQNRFSHQVTAQGERALAIRFSQPSRGVHYYLRRSGR